MGVLTVADVPEMVQHFLDATQCADPDCWVSHSMPNEGHYHVGGGWGVATRRWYLGVRWAAEQYAESQADDVRLSGGEAAAPE